VGEADCAETGLQVVLDLRPDVVLMDFVLRGRSRIEAIERIAELAPASRILVLTANAERDSLLRAIDAGACGYILKDAGTAAIVKGVRASAAGECAHGPLVSMGILADVAVLRAGGVMGAVAFAATPRPLDVDRVEPRHSGWRNRW